MPRKTETGAVTVPVPVPPAKFAKEQILRSKRYATRRDALGFLLRDDGLYTYQEIDEILNNYMKGKVK